MANNYTSTLFPDTGTQQNPGDTAVFDSRLWYMGNGHDSRVWALTRTIAADTLVPATHPHESKNWSQLVLDHQPNIKGYSARCAVQPSLCVAGDSMYFVWIQSEKEKNQPQNSVWATRYTPTGDPGRGTWSAPVPFCDALNDQLVINQSNFRVMTWGTFLVGCYQDDQSNFHLHVYDIGDWSGGAPGQWQPVATWAETFADWPHFPPSPSDLGNQLGMDWFALDGDHIYYIISFFNHSKNEAYVLHAINVKPFDEWSPSGIFSEWSLERWTGVYQGVNGIREPAGRMLAYHADSNGSINVRTMATNGVDANGTLWATFGPPQLLFGQQAATRQAPVPAFVWGPTTNPSTTIKVLNQQGQEQTETRTATVVQSYQFVMFCNDDIDLVYSHYGQAVQIPNAYQIENMDPNLPSGRQEKLFVTGIVDAPLPLPAVNVALQSDYNPQTLGNVEYGTTASTGDSRSTTWSWSAGFISSGYADTGEGVAWKISFNAGMSGATGTSSTDQIVDTVIADTNATQTSAIEPNGMMVLSTLLFHRDTYTFYDQSLTGDAYTEVTDAVTPTMVWITDTGVQNPVFSPYTVTTGNLWSYTRGAWNARMQELGYSGGDYFDDVILAQDSGGNYVNALVFSVRKNDNPYLEHAWSTGGQVNQAFTSVDQSYTESGWHLDASAYVGFSWGLGADVFGIGEKWVGKFLVGGSYSRSTQEKTTEGGKWGITVSYTLQDPPIAGNRYPGEIIAFSWRLYFLKSNALWLQEVLKYASLNFARAAQIDPGSAPWRILFEVVEGTIEFKGDNLNVVYRDTSGDVIELWYGTELICGRANPRDEAGAGSWDWINLTQSATAYKGGGSGGQLPAAEGPPCWFSWGMSAPGYIPYTQAIAFRAQNGDIYLLWGVRSSPNLQDPPPANTTWYWRNLAETSGFVDAAGNPAGYCWEEDPSGPDVHIIYRGVDGNIHELRATAPEGAWSCSNLTGSLAVKAASDPAALVWNEDPGGPSENAVYRGADNHIYVLRSTKAAGAWTPTDATLATKDGSTPTGNPHAFVWTQGSRTSLHIAFRGAEGEIHELRKEDGAWQPADDPSWDAHATAGDQLAAGDPVGFAWERTTAASTIHWYYPTDDGGGNVAELARNDSAANAWRWTNLSTTASGSGKPAPDAAMLPGYVWGFDPVMGSSMHVYYIGADGHIYEMWYDVPNASQPTEGHWVWNDVTSEASNAGGQTAPLAMLPNH